MVNIYIFKRVLKEGGKALYNYKITKEQENWQMYKGIRNLALNSVRREKSDLFATSEKSVKSFRLYNSLKWNHSNYWVECSGFRRHWYANASVILVCSWLLPVCYFLLISVLKKNFFLTGDHHFLNHCRNIILLSHLMTKGPSAFFLFFQNF